MPQSLTFWLQLSSCPPLSILLLALSPPHPSSRPIFSDNTIKGLNPWQPGTFPDPSSFPMFWSLVVQWIRQPTFSGLSISLVFSRLLDWENALKKLLCEFPSSPPQSYLSTHAASRDKTAVYRTDPGILAP